ncbi:hypothetical protein BJ166DRAFT_85322 [Pestalotiopsis sp. NC0098]|nr:hypothetical protein BJ166DRAFT_85322 [Pestalotiopsis sp. NC0098]
MFRIAIPSGPVMPVQDSCAYTYNTRLGPQPVGPSCLHVGNCTVCTAESSFSVVGRHEGEGRRHTRRWENGAAYIGKLRSSQAFIGRSQARRRASPRDHVLSAKHQTTASRCLSSCWYGVDPSVHHIARADTTISHLWPLVLLFSGKPLVFLTVTPLQLRLWANYRLASRRQADDHFFREYKTLLLEWEMPSCADEPTKGRPSPPLSSDVSLTWSRAPKRKEKPGQSLMLASHQRKT